MAKVEHLIVLMLENRSFDHMLGFLQHPDPLFEGLHGDEENIWDPDEDPAVVSSDAAFTIDPGPGHSHEDAMMQLTGNRELALPYQIDNSGFARNFEEVAQKEGMSKLGAQVMRCQHPDRIPVLATLALEFAVCDHWFCSVPGETWPNRNFAHAGTSDGEVNIVKRPFTNRTIFDQLSEANRNWMIFHDGIVCQTMAFPHLWGLPWRQRFRSLSHLYWSIAHDRLPHYAFVEPDYVWPNANSQHPFNNRERGDEFLAGERLIRDIYEALTGNPTVWQKTLFLITYDEHGGFYDHVAPPHGPRFRDGRLAENGFTFDLLGPRVPTVLVSPYIPRNTLETRTYDHSSIPATTRALFAPHLGPLTGRDGNANTFHHVTSLDAPRSADDIPHFPVSQIADADADLEVQPPPETIDDFQESMYYLLGTVDVQLMREEVGEAALLSADALVNDLQAGRHIPAGMMAEAVTYQERVARRFEESGAPLTILQTESGAVLENPARAQIERALEALQVGDDEQAELWLSDLEQRSIAVHPGGRVVYQDRHDTVELDGVGFDRQAELLQLFRDGQSSQLREAFD